MSQALTQTPPRAGTHSPALWRVAGGLALAHVVLLFAGFSQERTTALGDDLDEVRYALAEGSLTRSLAGGYVESLAFVLLLPVLVFLARSVGTRTPVGRWAAGTSLVAGVTYVAITLSTGMAAGAAALYGGHSSVDLETARMVADVRNFAFFLSLLVLALQAAALGVAALSDRFSPRWTGIGGVAVGVVLLVGVAGAALELHGYASLVWTVWWVGVAIALIRNAPIPAADARS
ncbi:hypothetical protein [Blastococcus atacamensis]|uniref:hypothetical protein n=1 Tax=Blastococcus atacamensis TaxID=2070508 RepID=UPI000CEC87B5|nr:hypothetical protein [Blastococcus atacamensis]